MSTSAPSFLWGASTAAHQVEGNNLNSDWWAREGVVPGVEPSGDAVDSYHRHREDMTLLAGAGLNSYRFGIEWARIEPRPGRVSRAELAHYRRMIDTAVQLGLTPVITLQHFTVPQWFAAGGGWMAERWNSPTVDGRAQRERIAADLPVPDPRYGHRLVQVHRAVRDIVREHSGAEVGWSIADSALTPTPGNEETFREVRYAQEDLYLEGSEDDDFLGVQSYSSQAVDANGIVRPTPPTPTTPSSGPPTGPTPWASPCVTPGR